MWSLTYKIMIIFKRASSDVLIKLWNLGMEKNLITDTTGNVKPLYVKLSISHNSFPQLIGLYFEQLSDKGC